MNAYAEGIVHLRERMKEKGFSKKDQQAIREMTRLYRHSKSTQHKRLKLNWHTPDQESEPWKWKQGCYLKWGVKPKRNQWQR
jgi:hypothetical protein